MLRRATLFFLLWIPIFAFANMGPPQRCGSLIAEPFLNFHVDILQEEIDVELEGFEKAHWEIRYQINSDSSGKQIPLLFLALNRNEKFEVFLDGQPISLLPLPDNLDLRDSIWNQSPNHFPGLLKSISSQEDWGDDLWCTWAPELNDFAYFEVDIDSGVHEFRVVYESVPHSYNTYLSHYVRYDYALAPAKAWRSFGGLTLRMWLREADKVDLSSNLPLPQQGSTDSAATWVFSELPEETMVSFSIIPHLSLYHKAVLWLGPLGCGIFFFLLMAIPPLVIIIRRRRRYPDQKMSLALTVAVPIIVGFIGMLVLIAGESIMLGLLGNVGGEGSYYFYFMFGPAVICGILYAATPAAINELLAWRYRRKMKNRAEKAEHSHAGDLPGQR